MKCKVVKTKHENLEFRNYGDTGETELKTKIQNLFDKAKQEVERYHKIKLMLTPSHLQFVFQVCKM